VSDDVEIASMEKLRADLESGEWDRRYGVLREQREYRGSLRLIVATPA
jgi:hypothetical protein